jgi:hypothetical protein
MDVVRIPVDRFVCDSCNGAITNTGYRVVHAMACLLDHGLYCPACYSKYFRAEKPLRVYWQGEVITDLSREISISAVDEFDPEDHR